MILIKNYLRKTKKRTHIYRDNNIIFFIMVWFVDDSKNAAPGRIQN